MGRFQETTLEDERSDAEQEVNCPVVLKGPRNQPDPLTWNQVDRKDLLYPKSNHQFLARWGVAEWIERPLLMLEVWGSNPGHSASKNTTSLSWCLRLPEEPGAPPDL